MDNLLAYLPCSFCKEKKEKRKEKGFSTPFLKRKEINKEKKLRNCFSKQTTFLLTFPFIGCIINSKQSFVHLSPKVITGEIFLKPS